MDGLPQAELTRIERDYAAGVPARVILEAFRPTGVRLSEATFRKYVQAGLLPRSRRVGEKGKHRGSRGLYPVETLRQLNAIRRMMSQGKTLEDIKGSFLVFRSHVDGLHRVIQELLDSFSRELTGRSFGLAERRQLSGQIATVRRSARELIKEVSRLGSVVMSRPARDQSW